MKNIMKTIIRSTRLVMLVFLPALLSVAQAGAVDYKSVYRGTQYEQSRQQTEYKIATTATAPSAGFQSTSALPTSGSAYTANPTIEENGSATTPTTTAPWKIGHIRKVDLNGNGIDDDKEEGEETGNAGTPGQTVNPQNQLPLGDAVVPLLLLAIGWGIYKRIYKRKRTQLTCP